MSRMIPVYVMVEGRAVMIPPVSEDEAERWIEMRRLRPIYGRRGHLKRLIVVERLTGLIHLGRDGYCKTQHLPNVARKVFALVGTPGSEDEEA